MLCQGEGVSPRLIDTHKNRTSVQTVALFYCHQKIFDIEHFLRNFIYMRNTKKKAFHAFESFHLFKGKVREQRSVNYCNRMKEKQFTGEEGPMTPGFVPSSMCSGSSVASHTPFCAFSQQLFPLTSPPSRCKEKCTFNPEIVEKY